MPSFDAILLECAGPALFEIAAVSMKDKNQHSRKQFRLDDVTYDVAVNVVSNGMFQAEWTCSACGEKGAWAPLSGDPTNAAELAKIGLEVHHSFLHRGIERKKL